MISHLVTPNSSFTHQGGNPDMGIVSRMILNDWQRGKLPYFNKPPVTDKDKASTPTTTTTTSKDTTETDAPTNPDIKDVSEGSTHN